MLGPYRSRCRGRARTALREPVLTGAIPRPKRTGMDAASIPRIIRSAEEFERVSAEIEALTDLGDRRTPTQDETLDLLLALAREYDGEESTIPDGTPYEVLEHL